MKSIYSKMILGFFLTIILSFSISIYIVIKSNYSQIENGAKDDLKSMTAYVSKLYDISDASDFTYLTQKYAESSQTSIAIYNNQNVMQTFGHTKKFISQEKLVDYYQKESLRYLNNDNLQSYGRYYNNGQQSYYIYIQKDVSYEKEMFTNSAMLILGCIFLSGSIVFLVVADVIVKPIQRLTNATKEITNGNYNVRVACTGNDEISRLTNGFNQMTQRMAKQDEVRQKFISDVSHEFQTPLTSIQGFANILKDEDLPKEQREKYANIILLNSKRLSKLAKNMLQLTLLDSQETVLEKKDYSLIEQLDYIIASMSSQADIKNIEVKFEHPKKDILIFADEQRMEQVWTNIISNSIKYTQKNGLIVVDVKTTTKSIDITIEDTGMGMSQDVISHIFERFYREEKARSVEGNGLGLSIVKTIIDLHGGTIDIQSQVDVGTVFTISIPSQRYNIKSRLNLK